MGKVQYLIGRGSAMGYVTGYITEAGRDYYLAELRKTEEGIIRLRASRNQTELKLGRDKNFFSCDRDPFADEEQQLIQRKNLLERYLGCQVCPPPRQCDEIRIGHTVHATNLGDDTAHVFTVVGMGEGDCPCVPPRYSYESAFARSFLGSSVGDEVMVRHCEVTAHYRIDDITVASLPMEQERKRA